MNDCWVGCGGDVPVSKVPLVVDYDTSVGIVRLRSIKGYSIVHVFFGWSLYNSHWWERFHEFIGCDDGLVGCQSDDAHCVSGAVLPMLEDVHVTANSPS